MDENSQIKSIIKRKGFLLLLFLILNSVTWFFLIMYAIESTSNSPTLKTLFQLKWIFFSAVLVSMLAGPLLDKKVNNRIYFLLVWVILGIGSSLSYAVLPSFGKYGFVILLVFWGVTFGIGFPSCLSLVSLLTKIETRGRAGGITFFLTYVILPLLFILIGRLDALSISLMLAIWRGLGLGAFLLHPNQGEISYPLKSVSYYSVIRRRVFLLYFLPWLAFCLMNYSEMPNFEQFFGESTANLMSSASFMIGCLSSIVSGWIVDLKGRRWGITLALVVIGLGYAILSVFPSSSFAQALFTIADGIAFGILTVMFMFVVWGDIADGERGEKFYAIGDVPVPLAIGLSTLISPWLVTLGANGAFSLASFFLLLAVIPIFFAPELLPERIIKKRELKEYVEKVKEITGRD